jgi:hypothetical protein
VNWIEGIDTISGLLHEASEAGEHPRTPRLRTSSSIGEGLGTFASINEWIDESEKRFSRLVLAAEEIPDRFILGRWRAAYSVGGVDRRPSLSNLLSLLRQAKGNETGWAPWWVPDRDGLAPYSFEGVVECWMAEDSYFQDPAHSDFWRASPTGSLYLTRGYQEDSDAERTRPGTILDVALPVWRVGECLLHASRLARLLQATDEIVFHFAWFGLAGRTLYDWASHQDFLLSQERSQTNEVVATATFSGAEVESGLDVLVANLVQPLYDAFLFEPPHAFVQAELDILRRGRV